MNHGRNQLAEGELREPKKKKVKPGTVLRDPYPIIFWNKLGIPPCKELWPGYMGVFDGDSVIVEDPGDMHEISTMGYFGKRLMCRRGYEQSIGDVPVMRERQWKRRVEWAAECGYVLVDGSPHTLASHVDNPELDTPRERVLEEEEVTGVELEVLPEDHSGKEELGSEITNGCRRGEPGDEDIQCGDKEKKEGEGKESAAKDSSGQGAEAGVSEDSSQKLRISGADGSSKELRGQQEEIRTDGEGVSCRGGNEGSAVQQLKGDESKDGSDHEVVALEDDEMGGASGGGEASCGEETDNGNIEPNETEAEMKASTDRLSRNGRGQLDQLGKGCESPLAVTSSRSEEDSQERVETKEETGLGSSMEVEAGKGGESPGEEVNSSKLKGREKGCQGMRRSPRSTRSSVSKLKESESRECESLEGGVLTGAGQGEAGGCARQSFSISHAQEGTGDALSLKEGDFSSVGMVSDKILGKRGPTDIIESEKNHEKEKQSVVVEGGEGIVSSSSKVKKLEKEKASGSKSGEKSNDVLEKVNEETNDGEVKSEDAEQDGAKGESQWTSGRTRGPKRNRSSSSCDISSVDKVEEKCGGGSTERMGEEDFGKVVAKRVKVSEVSEEEEQQHQQAEVNVSTTEVSRSSGTGGDNMTAKVEPKLAEEPIEKEGSSSTSSREKKEEVDKLCAGGRSSVEEKSEEEVSLNKGSSDCEIVEIEDESNIQNPSVPISETPSARAFTSTPLKGSSKGSPKKDVPCATEADSDDDIMEVSIEEVEVREVARDRLTIPNRRGRNSGMTCEGMPGNSKNTTNGKNCNENEKVKFQKMLREIRKTLPRDVEVVQVNLKNFREEAAALKECPKATRNTGTPNNDNDDDDVIEINLQQSDMMELEDCDGEEGGGDDEDDCEVERVGEQARCLPRRMMRKESSGFRRKEKFGEGGSGCGDLLKMKEEVEVEGTESITTGNLGSDCEVAPCVVIPDSDSEAEEIQGSPRLESDPSVFLPSLDVLQLIPEEAFFLAYGLGCLMVWDARNMDLEPNKCDDHEGGGSAPINKTLGKNCSDELKFNDSIKRESSRICNETGNIPSFHAGLDDRQHTMNKSDPSDHGEDCSSKSVNGCDAGDHPGYPIKGPVTCAIIKNVEDPVVDQLELDSDKDVSNKSSVEEIESSATPPDKASNRMPGGGIVSVNVDKERSAPVDNASEEEIGVLAVKNKSDPVPVNAHDQQNENNLESSLNDSLSIVYDAGSPDETANESRNLKKGCGDNKSSCFADKRGGISDSHVPPKENGDLGDPAITVIDLADSPPSRQWARKGWPPQDEEDVVAMDSDVHDVSLVDPEPTIPDHPNERTLSSEYQRPMSIVELWNAFRSCRASVSSAIPFETAYAVYHHFRSKRWVVKPGIRFGGDFLLYKDGPPFYHASYLVVIDSSGPDGESKLDWKMLSGLNRLAENIAKDLILCRVEWFPSITEEELQSPECLTGLVVQEVLVRRWVSVKEREAGHQLEEEDDDQESFIPLKL